MWWFPAVSCVLILTATLCGLVEAGGDDFLTRPCHMYGCPSGSTCDYSNGECTCTPPDIGHLCQTPDDTCNNECDYYGTEIAGDGECESSTGDCICTEGYTGVECEHKRINAACDATDFTITVRPYSFADDTSFFGAIYADPVEDFSSLPIDCQLVDDGNSVYSLTVTYANGDGANCAAPVQTTNSDGDEIVEYYIYVSHMVEIQLYSDQIFHITCKIGDTAIVNTLDFVGVSQYNAAALSSTHAEADGVQMSLVNEETDGVFTPITSSLTLGDPIAIVLQYETLFGVPSCIITDGDSSVLSLISSWCVDSYAAGVFRSSIGHSAATSSTAEGGTAGMVVVNIPIIAFYFVDSVNFDIFVSCEICLDEGCAPDTELACTDTDLDDTLILNTHPSLREDYAVATSKERRRRDTVPQKKLVSTSHNSGPAIRRQRDVSKEGSAAKRKKRERVSLGGESAKTSLTVSISVEDPKVTNDGSKDGSSSDTNPSVGSCFQKLSVLLPLVLLFVLLLVSMIITFIFCFQLMKTDSQNATGKTIEKGM